MSRTVVSSPGKVLIAGGYLVLDPRYPGIVVSTSSRFYTVIEDSAAAGAGSILVRSPQFVNATWGYHASFGEGGSVKVDASSENKSKNKFVQIALQNAVRLAAEIKGTAAVEAALAKGLDIAIEGGNDFYSQRAKLASLNLPRTLDSLAQIPPFAPTGVALSDVHKTGLGSSAALITSLVAGLLAHLGAIAPAALTDENHPDRRLAHNAAQFVHCLAQGKIGSGFDVSAAVFGSHLYQRFDPEVLGPLMGDKEDSTKKILPVLSPENKSWNYQVSPFQLPPLTRIMLADVDAGSDTPSLVGQVLKWRKESSEEANALWTTLDKLNRTLADVLLRISDLHAMDQAAYAETVSALAGLPAREWVTGPGTPSEAVRSAFHDAHTISEEIRGKMREMGTLAGVPIEPPEQTKLLDACIAQAGAIAGGVPGAGGYDAVWLLVFEVPDGSPVKRVQDVWANYAELDVSPLSASESLAKGIRSEKLEDVKGLKEAISR